MVELSIIETHILELIPRGAGSKAKVSYISSLVGLSSREVKSVILSLRKKGVPIVALRGIDSGMFIATNETEREMGLRAFKSQQQSMESTIKYIEKADLVNWKHKIYRQKQEKFI